LKEEGLAELVIKLSVVVDESSVMPEESTPELELDDMSLLDTVEDGISGDIKMELRSGTLEDGLGGIVGRTSVDDSSLEDGTSALELLGLTPEVRGTELLYEVVSDGNSI
jgi:hypothetical protein